jgi:hypothetical protein
MYAVSAMPCTVPRYTHRWSATEVVYRYALVVWYLCMHVLPAIGRVPTQVLLSTTYYVGSMYGMPTRTPYSTHVCVATDTPGVMVYVSV